MICPLLSVPNIVEVKQGPPSIETTCESIQLHVFGDVIAVTEVDRHVFEVRKRPCHDIYTIHTEIFSREGRSYSLGEVIGRFPAACLTASKEVFAELAARQSCDASTAETESTHDVSIRIDHCHDEWATNLRNRQHREDTRHQAANYPGFPLQGRLVQRDHLLRAALMDF